MGRNAIHGDHLFFPVALPMALRPSYRISGTHIPYAYACYVVSGTGLAYGAILSLPISLRHPR
eukprot:3942000-Rhodomonas_salina.5